MPVTLTVSVIEQRNELRKPRRMPELRLYPHGVLHWVRPSGRAVARGRGGFPGLASYREISHDPSYELPPYLVSRPLNDAVVTEMKNVAVSAAFGASRIG